MRVLSMTILAAATLGAAFTLPASANNCPFPCFKDSAGSSGGGFGGNARAVNVASRYLGTNPTGRKSLWCAEFMNMMERKMGRPGTGSAMAKSYASYGRRVSNPRPGDIAVISRKGGGHVGYVMSVSGGKVKLISGNHGRKVGVGTYSRSRVIAFVRP
jgi:uncharacterized protein (TIGR02594 family)